MEAVTATLDEPVRQTQSLKLHRCYDLGGIYHEVSDEIVEKVHKRVLEGMGLVCCIPGISQDIPQAMGTECDLKWREIGEKERLG